MSSTVSSQRKQCILYLRRSNGREMLRWPAESQNIHRVAKLAKLANLASVACEKAATTRMKKKTE